MDNFGRLLDYRTVPFKSEFASELYFLHNLHSVQIFLFYLLVESKFWIWHWVDAHVIVVVKARNCAHAVRSSHCTYQFWVDFQLKISLFVRTLIYQEFLFFRFSFLRNVMTEVDLNHSYTPVLFTFNHFNNNVGSFLRELTIFATQNRWQHRKCLSSKTRSLHFASNYWVCLAFYPFLVFFPNATDTHFVGNCHSYFPKF